MTRWHIEITKDAVKVLAGLDKPVRRRLQRAIDALGDEPRPTGIVGLKSAPDYLRLRVGDYRVIYRVEDEHLLVIVVALGRRREIYDRYTG